MADMIERPVRGDPVPVDPPEPPGDPEAPSGGQRFIDDFLASLEGVDADALLGLSEAGTGVPGAGGLPGGGRTSGSRSSSSGGGPGGRGVGDDALIRQLMGLVSDDVAGGEIDGPDPALRQQLLDIIGNLEAQRGQLVELDDATRADLEAQTAAERALFERQIEEQQQELLVRLFGQQAQTSTVAGDVGRRLVEGSALGLAQIEAGAAERRLGVRTALTEQSMGNLQLQANLTLGQQAQDLSDRELEFRQVDALRNLRATLLDSALNRRSAIMQTRIDANSRVKAASIGANASVKVARINAATDRYGINVGARSQLTSDLLDAFGEGERLEEQGRQFDLDLDLRRFLGTEDIRLQERGLALESQRIRNERRSSTLASLAGIALGIGQIAMMSDPRLKDNLEPLENATDTVRGMRGHRWDWAAGLEALPQAPVGVNADEVEAVLPEAVRVGRLGVKTVDLSALVGVLVSALNEALDRIDQLEAK